MSTDSGAPARGPPALADATTRRVYSMYKEADRLPETSGDFSLNLRPGAVRLIEALLRLRAKRGDAVLWVGCGTGPEVIAMALRHPTVRFVALDTNKDAIEVARRKVDALRVSGHQLSNLETRVADAMREPVRGYTHVYSTAIAGPVLYAKLRSLAAGRVLCMLREMWEGETGGGFEVRRVYLSGSGGQKQLMARRMPGDCPSDGTVMSK